MFAGTLKLMGVAVIALSATLASAQTLEIDINGMSNRELYTYAENLRLGRDAEIDPDTALILHEKLALAGNALSYVRMATILLSQNRIEEAMQALENGREMGSDFARSQLAIGHVRNSFGDRSDPEFGVAELEDLLRSSDNSFAAFVLATAYESGTGTDVNIAKAREMFEDLAAQGHAMSLAKLGQYARTGTFADPDQLAAIEYYRAAAEGGFSWAWMVLANLTLEVGDYEQSIEAYEQAVANGIAKAGAEFARRHFLREFGQFSDRELGAQLLEARAEAGDVDAISEALILWERRSRRIETLDLEGVIAILDEKMREGDELATRALARAYRVLRWRIPKARTRHAQLVEEFGDQLGRHYMREYLFDTYDLGAHASSRRAAYDVIRQLQGQEFRDGAMALRATEPTAFVYLLQKELSELGYANLRASGTMNGVTLRAVLRFCDDNEIMSTCTHGPLTYPASFDISRVLAEVRQNN